MFENKDYSEFTEMLFGMGNRDSMGYGLATTIFSYRNTTLEQYNNYKVALAKATIENDVYAMDSAMHGIRMTETKLRVYNDLLNTVSIYMDMDKENA